MEQERVHAMVGGVVGACALTNHMQGWDPRWTFALGGTAVVNILFAVLIMMIKERIIQRDNPDE